MTFRNDNGGELNFDGQFAMSKQAVSFFSGIVKGDVSINFAIDNNSENRAVLNYYGPQMTSQVAWVKQPFNRIKNGNVLDRGYIVIQSEETDILNCFYVSGNSNWIQLLDGLITELDYTGIQSTKNYRILLNQSTVLSLQGATDGVVFPMIDWAYNFKKSSNYWSMNNLYDVSGNLSKSFIDFYPCFYVSTLLKEVVSQNGLKVTGNLLNDPLFKSLAITPSNIQFARESISLITGDGQSPTFIPAYTGAKSTLQNLSLNYPNQIIGNYFTIGNVAVTTGSGTAIGAFTSTVYSSLTISVSGLQGEGSNLITVNIMKNGNILSSLTATAAAGTGLPMTFNPDHFSTDTTVIPGDVIYFTAQRPAGTNDTMIDVILFSLSIPSGIHGGDYIDPSQFLPKISSVDILKYLINRFGCCVTFDEFNKTITMNIIENFVTESAYDWSAYYISHRSEYTVAQAANNYLRQSQTTDDTIINNYNNQNFKEFGDGNIQTQNTLNTTNEVFQLPFAGALHKNCINKDWLCSIPLVVLTDSGEGITYTSASNSGGFEKYSGAWTAVFKVGEVVRIVDDSYGERGYCIITTIPSSTTITVNNAYSLGLITTGKIYRQSISYTKSTSREIIVKNIQLYYFGSDSSYYVYDSSMTASSAQSNVPYGFYSKTQSGLGIDQIKANLAFDNVSIAGYSDPTFNEMYFNKITNFFNKPSVRVQMMLPEVVYSSFNFDQFIYLKTETLTGYFFVDSIVNYIDGNNPVEVNLYML